MSGGVGEDTWEAPGNDAPEEWVVVVEADKRLKVSLWFMEADSDWEVSLVNIIQESLGIVGSSILTLSFFILSRI